GDYARTQDSLANVERRLQEQQKELMEQIGNEVMPVFRSVLLFFASFNDELQKSSGSLSVIGGIAKVVGTAFIGVITVLKHVGTLIGGIAASLVHLATGQFRAAIGALEITFDTIVNNTTGGYDTIINMWKTAGGEADSFTDSLAGMTKATNENTKARTRDNDEMQRTIDLLRSIRELEGRGQEGSKRYIQPRPEAVKPSQEQMLEGTGEQIEEQIGLWANLGDAQSTAMGQLAASWASQIQLFSQANS
ncbi:unnamed protein product, partial [marine sediment metagenome]